jgi:hypothetical protein
MGVTGTAVVQLREWSVASLAAHGALDAEHVTAAQRFCRSWEAVHGMRTSYPALTERVDSGRRATSVAEASINAAQDLRHARILLGEHGYALVGKICGDGYHIRDLYRTRRERDTAADMLKVHLTALAKMWA